MKHVVAATPDEVRETLRTLAQKTGVPLAPLSRMVGRRSGYLSEFVRGVGPRRLTESERHFLARFFRVDPSLFGDACDAEIL